MFKKIVFLKDFGFAKGKDAQPTFRQGEELIFRPGLNLLVGDQGCGKSTLLTLLKSGLKAGSGEPHYLTRKDVADVFREEVTGLFRMAAFDMEQDLGRVGSTFKDDLDYGVQIQNRWSSHGQAVLRMMDIVEGLERREPGIGFLMLLDEPDIGLSPRSVHRLVKILEDAVARKIDFFVAAHNPILIASQPEVLSLEHRRWMPSQEFLSLHKGG